MSRKPGHTYYEEMQALMEEYVAASDRHQVTTQEVMRWAIDTGRWVPPPHLVLKQASEELARALREEYVIDQQGRKVRVKHAARVSRDGVQQSLWADSRDPAVPPGHIETALKQRRQQIVGDCYQLKMDTDSYNQNWNAGRPVQMVFDFTLDLEELEASGAAA